MDDPRPILTAEHAIGVGLPFRPKEKAYKAHSSQGRHRRVKSPHKWATEEQFVLIVVIRNFMVGHHSFEQQPYGARQLLPSRTGYAGKHIVRIRSNQSEGANDDDQNDCQHHRVFSDVLRFFLRPQFAEQVSHLRIPSGFVC